jgi:hypothetical protein
VSDHGDALTGVGRHNLGDGGQGAPLQLLDPLSSRRAIAYAVLPPRRILVWPSGLYLGDGQTLPGSEADLSQKRSGPYRNPQSGGEWLGRLAGTREIAGIDGPDRLAGQA